LDFFVQFSRTKAEYLTFAFQETVDYRYDDDPPSRPYVPWLEGYTMRGCGAQQLPRGQQQKQVQQELLPLDLTIAAPVLAQTPPAVATTDPKCGVVGGSDDVRPRKRMTVDVVKFKRLDVSLT
jgi:hypothetical protein